LGGLPVGSPRGISLLSEESNGRVGGDKGGDSNVFFCEEMFPKVLTDEEDEVETKSEGAITGEEGEDDDEDEIFKDDFPEATGDIGVGRARTGRGGGDEQGDELLEGIKTSGIFSSANVRISLISFGFDRSSFSEIL
jgi:hypothetical protein